MCAKSSIRRCHDRVLGRPGPRWYHAPFFAWYNDEHQHSGLALFTPSEVFFERVAAVHAVRQEALNTAYAINPERFPNGPPVAHLPPTEVHINPLEADVVLIDSAPAVAATPLPLNIHDAYLANTTPLIRTQPAAHAT